MIVIIDGVRHCLAGWKSFGTITYETRCGVKESSMNGEIDVEIAPEDSNDCQGCEKWRQGLD